MLLLRGATFAALFPAETGTVSIHAPLARSNDSSSPLTAEATGFNTCSSCEEQHCFKLLACRVIAVSIHAPLARSNSSAGMWFVLRQGFNTCSSCEEQHASGCASFCRRSFQYMLLLRGATWTTGGYPLLHAFQYMLLLRGATKRIEEIKRQMKFQYMLLLRGATERSGEHDALSVVSIHAPLARSNFGRLSLQDGSHRFNTCSSCEEQLAR